MKVICVGNKICPDAQNCEHSRPHEIIKDGVDNCFLIELSKKDQCTCRITVSEIRKLKLEKLENESRR
jgi:hypothetical protein